MSDFFKKHFIFECPYCGDKCISMRKKFSAFYWDSRSRCKNCGVVLKCDTWFYQLNGIITIAILILFFYIAKTFQSVNTFLLGFFPIAMQTFVYMFFFRIVELNYRPDGKHPERIYKKEAQTLYGTMLFYVEDNVLYEQDYVVRVINQEQEVEFRISKDGYKTENVIDLVYNDDRQSIFRIFDHYVTLQTGEMVISSSFSVN